MSTKISELTTTGSAPSGSYLPIAFNGQNYKVSASNFSTGWVNTDGTTSVADGATLQFDHGLGTTDVIIEAYYADDASGTNAKRLQTAIYTGGIDGGGATTEAEGYEITAITTSSITMQLGNNGIWTSLASDGSATTNENSQISYSGKYIKLLLLKV